MGSKKESIPASCSDSNKSRYSCDECEQTLPSLAKLNYHKQAHKKLRSMTCNICEKVFSYSGNLARHRRIHSGVLAYKCPICGRAFNQASHRSRHMKFVHKMKNVGSSMKSDTGNKQCYKKEKKSRWTMGNGYECDVCGKNFKKAQSLKVHKKSHPKPSATLIATPFLCDVCGKAFKRSGTLAAHITQHTRKKLSFCDICKKGYSSAQALVVHTRTHTGERPYKCNLCDDTFRQQGHLKQHIDTVHSNETKKTPSSKISRKSDVTFANQTQHPVSAKLDKNENHVDQLPCRKGDPTPRKGKVMVHPNQKKSKINPISRKCKQSNENRDNQVNLQGTTYKIYMKKEPPTISNGKQVKMNPVSKKLNKQTPHHNGSLLNQLEGEVNPKSTVHVRQISKKMDNLAHQHHLWCGDSLNQISKKSEKLAHDNEQNKDLRVGVNPPRKNSKKQDHLDLDDANQQILGKSTVGPNQCDVCGKIFKQKSYIKIHKRIHTGEKPYSCKICGQRYRFVHHLKFHVDSAICGTPTGQLETSDREELTHTCNYCGMSHGNNANCDKPSCQQETSDGQEPSHTCNYCGKVYDNASLLEIHQRCHEDEMRKKIESMPSDDKPHKCQFCPKAFKSKAHIDMHERVHTGCRPYQCNLCNKAFKQVTHLSSHKLRIHHKKSKGRRVFRKPKSLDKKNPYKCEFCTKTFELEKQLRLHKKMHKMRTEPFECHVCGKVFKVLNNLLRHELVHTGKKPFVCEICGKGCTQKSNLDNHVRRIHKNSNLVIKSDKLKIGHGVQTDSNSDKKSAEESYLRGHKANVDKESDVVTHSPGKLQSEVVHSKATKGPLHGINKDSEVFQSHEDSRAKPGINKKRNLLTELRYKNTNSSAENSSNRKSSDGSENASKAKIHTESVCSGGQMSNKQSEVKEDYSKSKNEYLFTRITKSKLNSLSSSGDSSETRDTKCSDETSKCDETFDSISTEEFERHKLSHEIGEDMFVCCECGEKFEQESCMMKHCVDIH